MINYLPDLRREAEEAIAKLPKYKKDPVYAYFEELERRLAQKDKELKELADYAAKLGDAK